MFKDFEKQISYCTFCPKLCRFACPVTEAEARETVTPTDKLVVMHLLNKEEIKFTPEAAEIFYHCAGCLTCRAYCKHRIDVPEVIEEARRLAFNHGLAPASLERFNENIEDHGNPYGSRLREKLDALGLASRHGRKCDTVFFIGCTTLYNFPETVLGSIKLLEAAGVDFAVHAEGSLCCGTPALLSGNRRDMKRAAAENVRALKSYKRIISGCPSCLATMKFKYPGIGFEIDAEFIHLSQFITKLVKDKKISLGARTDERVMYHDPCHLGKFFGVFDEPRFLLSQLYRGGNVIEFSRARDKNACCGGGGLLPVTNPQTFRNITLRRLEEFREAAPDMLITACPTCERTFSRVAPDIKVRNLLSLVAERLAAK